MVFRFWLWWVCRRPGRGLIHLVSWSLIVLSREHFVCSPPATSIMATACPSQTRATQTTQRTTTSSQAASLRKPATAAARGSTLAVHAAAGLADSVHREAARLLRASEGLARAALALLEASAKTAEQPTSTLLGPGHDVKLPKAPRTPGKGKSEGHPGGKTRCRRGPAWKYHGWRWWPGLKDQA